MADTPTASWLTQYEGSGFNTEYAQDMQGDNDGILYNTTADHLPLPEWITDTPTGVGLGFNGTSGADLNLEHQFVEAGYEGTLWYEPNYAIGCRFRTTANSGKGGPLVDFQDDAADLYLPCPNTAMRLYVGIYGTVIARLQTSGWGSGAEYFYLESPSAYNNGHWHSALVKHCNGTTTLYVDNIAVATLTRAQYDFNSALRIRISPICFFGLGGALEYRAYAKYQTFDGDICDVRYWENVCVGGEQFSSKSGGKIFIFSGGLA